MSDLEAYFYNREKGIVYSVCLSFIFRCAFFWGAMGSLLGNWPSYDPHNFSQLRPSDPTTPVKMTPTTYHATHDRTLPPPDQVITTESKSILLRHMYQQHAEEKLRQKRAASENLLPEHGCKQLRASISDKS